MTIRTIRRGIAAPLCLAFALAILGLATVGTSASQAQWIIASYCGFAVPPKSACSDTVTGRYAQNGASYPGAGTVGVCQKGEYLGSQMSRTCANNSVWGGNEYGWYYNNNLHVKLYAGNDSPWTHTIHGNGYIPASLLGARTTAAPPSSDVRRQIAVLRDTDGSAPKLAARTSSDAVSVMANGLGEVCITTERFGLLTCNSLENTATGGNSGVVICASDLKPGNIAIYGAVPNGAQTVALQNSRGAVASASVVDNVYALEVPANAVAGVSSVLVSGSGKTLQASVAVPSDLTCS